MKIYLQLAFLLAIVIAAAAMVLKYNDAIDDAAVARDKVSRLEGALAEQTNALETLQIRYEMVDQVLKEKQNDEEIVRRSLYRFERKLGDLRSADPVVRDWADTPIPDAVIGIMSERRAGNSEGNGLRVPAGELGSPDPDPGPRSVERPQKR